MSKVKAVDCTTLKEWLDKKEAILIDVREKAEYDQAHIRGSILIPVGTCSAEAVPHDQGKKIVFHCKAGKRGEMACTVCAQAMPERIVYNLTGGIDAWISQGYPYESQNTA
jgi:rhodanese-related sulfurtransferase